MCVTSGGKTPLFFSGGAICWPSVMLSRASSRALRITAFPTTALTMSSAVSTGTPLLSSVASVRAKRLTASLRTSFPTMGRRRTVASHWARPFSVASQRRER